MTQNAPNTTTESAVKELATNGQVSFYRIGDQVYRAPNNAGQDSYGHPLGKRWECTHEHWLRYRAIYQWVTDVA